MPNNDTSPPADVDPLQARVAALKAKLSPPQTGDAPGTSDSGTSGLTALWHGLLRGGRDVLEGGAQIGARMGPEAPQFAQPGAQEDLTRRVDTATRESEAAYQRDPAVQAHPLIAGGGRIGGNIAATAPLSLVPGMGAVGSAVEGAAARALPGIAARAAPLAGRVAEGAVSAALPSALQPVPDTDDYWQTKAKQLGIGMMTGGAMNAALGRLAPTGDAARLQQAGVPLTAGMQIGMRQSEEQLKHFPILYNFIRRGEGRSLEGFQRAVANQTLDPIGATVPGNVKAGHPLVEWVEDRIGDAYDRVLPKISLSDNEWGGFLGSPEFHNAVGGLTADEQKYVGDQLNRSFGNHFKSGILTGNDFKLGERQFRTTAFARARSEPAVSDAMTDLLGTLRDNLANANPQYGKDLRNINKSYAMYMRLRGAANKVGADGQFSPTDLLQATRRQDLSAQKGSFARGDALLQPFAEAANNVFGKDVRPGTPYNPPSFRRLTELMLGGASIGGTGGALTGGLARAGVGAGVGGAIGAAPYLGYGAMRATAPLGRLPQRGRIAAAAASGQLAAREAQTRDLSRQRLKAAAHISQLRQQRFNANAKGDIQSLADLDQQIRDARRELENLRVPASQ